MLLTYLALAAIALLAVFLYFFISAIRSIRAPHKARRMTDFFTVIRGLDELWPAELQRAIQPRMLRNLFRRRQSLILLYMQEFLLDAARQARHMLELSDGSGVDGDALTPGRVKLREVAGRLLRCAILRIVRVRLRMVLCDHAWYPFLLSRQTISGRILNARFQAVFREFMEVSKEFGPQEPPLDLMRFLRP